MADARAFSQDIVKGEGAIPADGLGPGKRIRARSPDAAFAEQLTFAGKQKRRPDLDPMTQQILQGGRRDDAAAGPKGRPGGLPGTLMKSLSSHPRYYEQKTAAEEKLNRRLTPEEFETNYWVEPQSELNSGTSIFDPVLCELAYRWFCPPGGVVLDPFAGGSVRGIVAAKLGRAYCGIDLRPEQAAANERQAEQICAGEDPAPKWIVGDAAAVLPGLDVAADFVFSCPPYGDLEVYSDDPLDLSTMDREAFLAAYRLIIAAAVARLKPDRFACFVVGDYRDASGYYAGFVGETISAFAAAGARLYNEAILVTAAGSLPIRAGKQFAATRKLGKTHQNVLVFCNGDPRKATEACGEVEIDDAMFAGLEAAEGAGGEDEFGEQL